MNTETGSAYCPKCNHRVYWTEEPIQGRLYDEHYKGKHLCKGSGKEVDPKRDVVVHEL